VACSLPPLQAVAVSEVFAPLPEVPESSLIDLTNSDAVRAEAERRAARRAEGKPLALAVDEMEHREAVADERLEREIQAECVREYRANGCIVYEGLKEKRKTKIQPGWPDLGVFHPRTKTFWFHEVKTPTGTLRPDQADFRETCLATGVPHYVGGIEVARQAISALSTITPVRQP
jgi:hypothetical protein